MKARQVHHCGRTAWTPVCPTVKPMAVSALSPVLLRCMKAQLCLCTLCSTHLLR